MRRTVYIQMRTTVIVYLDDEVGKGRAEFIGKMHLAQGKEKLAQ